MAAVFPDEGEVVWLRRMLTPDAGDSLLLHLRVFKNNFTPLKASTLADFTEADFAGYAAADIDPATWPAPSSVGGVAQSMYLPAPQVFTCTAGTQDVYGWYLTDNADTVCLAAERFSNAPQTITPTVPALVVLLIQLHSEYEP